MGQTANQIRNDSVLVAGDLEAIDTRLFAAKEGELKARQLVPLKNDLPAGIETYSYDRFTRKGAAVIFAAGATKVPLVDVDVERVQQPVVYLATGFQVTTPEIQAARLAGRPVDTYKADAARRAIAEKENSLALVGDATANISGIISASGIQVLAAPNGAGGKATWADKTALERIADVRTMSNAITKYEPHTADILALPVDQFALLQEPVSANDTRTVYQYILANGWFKQIISLRQLDGAGAAGVDAALALNSDPDVAELIVPGNGQDIFRGDPVPFLMGYEVAVWEQCGGSVVRYPLAIVRMDGI